MFALSLLLAVLMILTALIPFSVRSRWLIVLPGLAWAAIWGLVVLVNNHMRFPPAVGWLFLFLVIAFPIVRMMKLNWIWFQTICLCCAMVAYGISMFEFIPAFREHQELLALYPAVDLKPRLAYEQRSSKAIGDHGLDAGFANASPKYDAEVLRQLDDGFRTYLDLYTFHVERRRIDRRLAFQALMHAHEDFVADFIAQPGVGRSRIPGLKLLRKSNFIDSWEGVRIDVPPELIKQPDPAQPPPVDSDKALSAGAPEGDRQPNSARSTPSVSEPQRLELQSLHHHNITNFVPLFSLGGVNDQLQARGFDAHAFHLPPSKAAAWEDLPKVWRIARIELVSLLKHRPAAVYVSEHLPAMDELRDAPVRAVTTFESDAIAKLLDGQDLIVETSGNHELSMVGSIRAISDCRQCHRVPLGGLLGAFSYRLEARSPMPQAAEE